MTKYEIVSTVVALVSVLVNVLLFLGFGLQLRMLRKQIEQAAGATERDHCQRRQQATLDFVTATLDRMDGLRSQGLPGNTRDAVATYIDRPLDFDDERNNVIGRYLRGYETLATGVNVGLYDIEVVTRLRGTMVVRVWELYRPWIDARRVHQHQPRLYAEFEEMAQAVRQRLRDVGQNVEIV